MSTNLSANMRKATEALVYAFDGPWSAEEAVAPRAPDCEHHMLPASLGVPPRNNTQFATWLKRIEHMITDAKMTIEDYVADPGARRAVCRTHLEASSPGGPYTNDYCWFLTFDNTGEKIVKITEFMDRTAATELRKKLDELGLLKAGVH